MKINFDMYAHAYENPTASDEELEERKRREDMISMVQKARNVVEDLTADYDDYLSALNLQKLDEVVEMLEEIERRM